MVTKGNDKSGQKQVTATRRPAREFRAGLSKDGKYWLLRDTTTWFIPVNYLAAIQKSALEKASQPIEAPVAMDENTGGENGRSH